MLDNVMCTAEQKVKDFIYLWCYDEEKLHFYKEEINVNKISDVIFYLGDGKVQYNIIDYTSKHMYIIIWGDI